jgi:hypothetical protein
MSEFNKLTFNIIDNKELPETPKTGKGKESKDTNGIDKTQKNLLDGLLKNKKMYHLSGFPDITKEDIQKYLESNRKISKQLPTIIQQGLNNQSWYVRQEAILMIKYAPKKDQPTLQKQLPAIIQQGLDSKDWYARLKAIPMIDYVLERDQPALRKQLPVIIQQELNSDYWDIHLIAARMIDYALKEDQSSLRKQLSVIIQQGLDSKDWYVYQRAIFMIDYAPEEDQPSLRKQVPAIIQQELDNKDWYVRRGAIYMIEHALKEDQLSLQKQVPAIIQQGLNDQRWYVRQETARMIRYAPAEAQEELWKLAEKQWKKNTTVSDLGELAEQTPLYYKNNKRFFRKIFKKNGSGIILLDIVPGNKEKSHLNKIIIRKGISIPSYFAWKEAFESYDFWKSKGFDYVPVEPIIRARINTNTSEINVFTRVLKGPSVEKWLKNKGHFFSTILSQIEQIEDALAELGIKHGHLHYNNFVLYFKRDEHGKPNISQPPRIYVIDFDMAKLTKK